MAEDIEDALLEEALYEDDDGNSNQLTAFYLTHIAPEDANSLLNAVSDPTHKARACQRCKHAISPSLLPLPFPLLQTPNSPC